MIKNKEYKNLGIKNYYAVSDDGRIQKGIAKSLKKRTTRITRKRLKNKLKKEVFR